ncbi:MAG: c-type cytochrome [Bdellovibrionales bacterium]|nr:c-type cytochrome [Bdellovibrionales bacterium]
MGDSKNLGDHVIEGHDYDGIQELNNPLPAWWLGIFWATCLFGLAYYIYYELAGGPTLDEELQTAMSEIHAVKEEAQAANPTAAPKSDEELNALVSDPAALEKGAQVFQTNCVACHGAKGEGTIGPNLTDDYWIHKKGTMSDIVSLIKTGVPDKGMPPWEAAIAAEDIEKTAAFIVSLKGTNPPNAKAPQGEQVTE